MARRLISASLAIPIGIFILWLDRKEMYLIAIAVISAMAVYEILVATKYINHRLLAVSSLLFVISIPFILNYDVGFLNTRYISFGFIIGLFVLMLFSHARIKFAEVALVSMVSLLIPFSMSCIGFMYDQFPSHRTFTLVYVLTVTWIADSGAFFAGTFLGKHKMAPEISPKKTWEGFIGGIITAIIFGLLLGKGYELIMTAVEGELTFKVDLLFLALFAIPCTFLGVLGDFTASLLKRECAVKDFGNIMPGHGGVMDRFDSILFVLPFAYLIFLQYFPVVDL